KAARVRIGHSRDVVTDNSMKLLGLGLKRLTKRLSQKSQGIRHDCIKEAKNDMSASVFKRLNSLRINNSIRHQVRHRTNKSARLVFQVRIPSKQLGLEATIGLKFDRED